MRLWFQRASRRCSAFTLLEVMIASGILFVCLFAVLSLVSNSLANARRLQRDKVELGTVASWLYVQLAPTNRMPEGPQILDLEDLDESYQGYECTWETYSVATNGLYKVEIQLRRRSGGSEASHLSFLLYNPTAQQRAGGIRR